MPTIHLTTFIGAPHQVVFDLCRHMGLQKEAMAKHGHEAVGGTASGLIDIDDTVTWRGKHFFKSRSLQLRTAEMKRHEMFADEQVAGKFRQLRHERYFKPCDNGTILIDLFHFESPYGVAGRWFNDLYLTRYIRRILEQRNDAIRQAAESGKWKQLLPEQVMTH